MSETPQGPGWWQASDGRYYPPQPGPPPVPQATPPAPGGPGDGPPPLPGPSPAPAPKKSGAVVWILLAAMLGLVLVVIGLAVLLFVGRTESESDTATAERDRSEESTPAPTTSRATTSVPDRSSGGDVVVEETGLSVGPGYEGQTNGTAGAVVVNRGDEPAVFLEVVFTFTAEDGTPVATESTYIDAVDPGGTAYAAVEGVALQGDATGVEVTAVDDDSGMDMTGTVIPVEVTSVVPDEFFGLTVNGTAQNPTDEVVEGAGVQCVLRRGGTVVGGTRTTLDTMVPGAQIAWDTFTSDDWVEADTAECSAGVYDFG